MRGLLYRDQLFKYINTTGIPNTMRPITYPPPPASKILQTVRYKFHPLAQYRIDIGWGVFGAYRRQEEHETSAWAEEIPCKENKICDELRKLVGLRWGYVRFVSTSKCSSKPEEFGGQELTVVEWRIGADLHEFFCARGVLLLHEHHLQYALVSGTDVINQKGAYMVGRL